MTTQVEVSKAVKFKDGDGRAAGHTAVHRNPDADVKLRYPLWLEWGLLVSVLIVTVLVYVAPDIDRAPLLIDTPDIVIVLEDVPVTQQLTSASAPLKPVVPIASDLEEIIEDETEFDASDFSLVPIPGPPAPPSGKKKSNLIPPKQIVAKFPDYPEDLRKQGIKGLIVMELKVDITGKVIDHRILENTTGSDVLTGNAIKAAYRCLYKPASDGREPIVSWTKQVFEFNESSSN